jgi:hypothetical protein
MEPFQKAKTVMQKVVSTGDWKPATELLNELLEREELKRFKKSPSPYVQLEEVINGVARLTVFTASLHPPVPSAVLLVDDISFYDLAEALMAMYVFGKFDVRYMPRLRHRGVKASALRKVKKILEEVGIIKDGILSGIGQMAAKSLLHFVAKGGTALESIYLSALTAHVLLAEMRNFDGSARTVIMEATARHQRITSTVREWLRTSPKLYQRDLPLFYEWVDAVKDLFSVKKKEDFRFAI